MSFNPFQWTCPFCRHHQVVTENNFVSDTNILHVGTASFGTPALGHVAVRCVNPQCNEVYLKVTLNAATWVRQSSAHDFEPIQAWVLRPDSMSYVQPEYIPAPLRDDYYEACLIRDKSPKASATLARRCLQGMIRDFCNISKNRLVDEINELKKQIEGGQGPRGVEAETIDAIDAIRDIGNIGAHMEKDIDLIIEVDPGEAQALIELIELLFEDWYVARHKRTQRLANVQAIAAEKKLAIAEGRAQIAQRKQAAITDQSGSDDG